MYTLDYNDMSDTPAVVKAQLRELSYGPEEGTFYRWTFHTGNCQASILRENGVPVAWACITHEEDFFPVVGVFVHECYRGRGLARAVASYMLTQKSLPTGTAVYAVSRLWSSWPDVLANAGLVFFNWE